MVTLEDKERILWILQRFADELEGKQTISTDKLVVSGNDVRKIITKLQVDYDNHEAAVRKSRNRNQRKTGYKNHKKVIF